MSWPTRINARRKRRSAAFCGRTGPTENRAHIVQTAFSKEGERSGTEYFIEPNSEGLWLVRVKIDRETRSRDPGMAGTQMKDQVEFTCTVMERVEPPSDLRSALVRILTSPILEIEELRAA